MASRRAARTALLHYLATLPPVPKEAVYYRTVYFPFFRKADFLSGIGAQLFGGRWNSAGKQRTVYLSSTARLSFEEFYSHAASILEDQTVPTSPLVLAAARIRLQKVIDLRKVPMQKLGLSWKDLLEPPITSAQLSQQVGDKAASLGLEGVLVPSRASRSGHNIVIFPENLQDGSSLELIDS